MAEVLHQTDHEVRVAKEMMHRSAVIIPVLNEGDDIGRIVKGIKNEFPALDVIVVDDGSDDRSKEIAIETGAKVLSHVCTMGYGVALQTGYKYLKDKQQYDYVVQMDGDGQHNYKDIPKLLFPLSQNDTDLVIGSRFIIHNNGYKIPFIRKFGILFFRALVNIFGKNSIKDITSGLQAFNRSVLEKYSSDEMPFYYPDGDVLILLLKTGASVKEISTPMFANKKGKSMHNGLGQQFYYVITMILSILLMVLKTRGEEE